MRILGVSAWLKAATAAIVFTLAAATPAWAAITSCPATPTTISSLPATGFPVGPLVAPGCSTTNATFSNFLVGTASGNIPPVCTPGAVGCPLPTTTIGGPSSSLIYVSASTVAPGSIQLNSPGSSTANDAINGCKANSGSQGWCIQGATVSMVSTVTFTVSYNHEVDIIGDSGVLTVHASGGGSGTAGATAYVFQEVCPGVVSFSQGCAGYQETQAGQFNATFQKTLPFSLASTFAPGVCIDVSNSSQCTYAVRNTVVLVTNAGNGSFATLGPFDVINTPEPATLSLVGFALAGLGLLRRRRLR